MSEERSMWEELLSRRDLLKVGGASAGLALLAACSSGTSGGGNKGGVGGSTTLNALFMQQAAYSTSDIQGMTKAFTQANPNTKVNTTFVAYEALHDKIVAAAPAGTYDVVLMDVIWPAEFGSKHEVVDVTDKIPASWKTDIFPGALQTAEYNSRFYGVPWILDTKYFFYNKNMLQKAGVQVPKTWDEVVTAAKAIKAKGIVQYPLIWSWIQAEAVICDYAQLLGAFGGKFLDSSGQPAFNTGGGLQALEYMKQSLTDKITNPASTESKEDDVVKVVSQGQAAMALNWTYMFSLANDPKESRVAGQIAVAHTPAGASGAAPGCNGSMAMCIASGSKNKDAAWKYIEFITSQKIQDQYAKLSLPIWKSSYDEPQVVSTLPDVVAVAKTQLTDMILRPQVPSYNAASQIIQAAIQKALTSSTTPKQALDDAATQVAKL
jgi:multiple sugar transport system substrate-binding protein